MFSNSYLTDLKDGRCNADPSRISELARRNTMVLPHLKSSYPAETQFYKKDEFRDRDLQQGTLKDVSLITGTQKHLLNKLNSISSSSLSTPSLFRQNCGDLIRFSSDEYEA